MIHQHQFVRELLAAGCSMASLLVVPIGFRLFGKRDLPPPTIQPRRGRTSYKSNQRASFTHETDI